MKPIYCFLLLNIVWLTSCTSHKKENSPVVKVVMPAHTEIYNPYITNTNNRSAGDGHSQFKIYTYINVSCSSCLEKLAKWDLFQSQNPDFSKVAIIPVCHSRDNFELLKFLFESHKLPNIHLPLFLDIKDSFVNQNLTLARTGDFTALTDGEDRVLLTGDPLENKDVKDQFLQAIHSTE
jgi:hypothetical protein